jgi:triosephosphate isomerase
MQARKPLIAGNWKMFKTQQEAVETAKRLVALAGNVTACDMMIAPPFTALSRVHEVIGSSAIGLGAQNFFWEAEGPFTGEISAAMLVSVGCRYAIIGHSERRQMFAESDQSVNKKLAAAFKNGLIPVLCIGESE